MANMSGENGRTVESSEVLRELHLACQLIDIRNELRDWSG